MITIRKPTTGIVSSGAGPRHGVVEDLPKTGEESATPYVPDNLNTCLKAFTKAGDGCSERDSLPSTEIVTTGSR